MAGPRDETGKKTFWESHPVKENRTGDGGGVDSGERIDKMNKV
jgi:hypothetical protein